MEVVSHALVVQSASVAQLVLHDAPPQTYGAHMVVVPAVQVPLPSQVRALVATLPAHEAAAHDVPAE
jgi:hypothetical protein